MIYTKCDQELVRLMLEHCIEESDRGIAYFSKNEFLEKILYERKVYEYSKIKKLVWEISGIYHALSRMKYIQRNSFNRTFPNNERMREGLRYLLGCAPRTSLLRKFRESMKQIHFLELECPDTEELEKFKQLFNILRDEIK